jgi:hypothetical protein
MVELVTLAFPKQTHQSYSISKISLSPTALQLPTLQLVAHLFVLQHHYPITPQSHASDDVAAE